MRSPSEAPQREELLTCPGCNPPPGLLGPAPALLSMQRLQMDVICVELLRQDGSSSILEAPVCAETLPEEGPALAAGSPRFAELQGESVSTLVQNQLMRDWFSRARLQVQDG